MFRLGLSVFTLMFALALPAHAEVEIGTCELKVYNLGTPSHSLGYLVVTSPTYSGSTWTASQEYWFWTDTPFAPFPNGGFNLETYGTTPPAGLDPDNAVRYANDSFPSTTGTCDVDETHGRWFRLERGNTVLGWVQDSGNYGLNWYILGDGQGHALAKYPAQGSGSLYLTFNGPIASPPSTLTNCSHLFEGVL